MRESAGRRKMPLTIAPVGREIRILKVLAEEGVRRHLENLGLTTGAEIKVLSASGGSVILLVKNGRLAIDRDLAVKILVA